MPSYLRLYLLPSFLIFHCPCAFPPFYLAALWPFYRTLLPFYFSTFFQPFPLSGQLCPYPFTILNLIPLAFYITLLPCYSSIFLRFYRSCRLPYLLRTPVYCQPSHHLKRDPSTFFTFVAFYPFASFSTLQFTALLPSYCCETLRSCLFTLPSLYPSAHLHYSATPHTLLPFQSSIILPCCCCFRSPFDPSTLPPFYQNIKTTFTFLPFHLSTIPSFCHFTFLNFNTSNLFPFCPTLLPCYVHILPFF